MSIPKRHPAGQPIGGQFATSTRAESNVVLPPPGMDALMEELAAAPQPIRHGDRIEVVPSPAVAAKLRSKAAFHADLIDAATRSARNR